MFRGDAKSRTIDRTTTLTALGERVVFKDNKEAFFGMRVARELELPYDKAEVLTDASGKPTPKPIMDNTGVSGQYTSSEGLKGDEVWGTRGRWMMLTGTVADEPVTIAILDNPSNPDFPTFWHARGYGLFAANPLGETCFPEGKRTFESDARTRQIGDVPVSRGDSERDREAGGYREGVSAVRALAHAMTPLPQAWPGPSRPRPIVIIGAGSIVRTAHLPVYRPLGYPVAGIFDIRREAARATAAAFGIPGFTIRSPGRAPPRTWCSTSRSPAIRSSASSSSCRRRRRADPEADGRRPRGGAADPGVRATSAELIAAVNFQLRFSPGMLALRDLLARGALGDDRRHRRPHRDRPAVAPVDVSRAARRGSRSRITRFTISTRSASIAGEPRGVYCRRVAHPGAAAAARHAQLDHPRLRRPRCAARWC